MLVRTDLPDADPDAGATLALVVDTSGSTEASASSTSRERSCAPCSTPSGRAIRCVVLAADQTRAPGRAGRYRPRSTAARKTGDRRRARQARPRRRDATSVARSRPAPTRCPPTRRPASSSTSATVGPPSAIPTWPASRRDSRGARSGKPRLGAVTRRTAWPHARALAALTRGSGPLLSVTDSSDATAAATVLVAEALRPAFSDVELRARSRGRAGLSAQSRAPSSPALRFSRRGTHARPAPRAAVVLKWRDKSGLHAEPRCVSLRKAPDPEDIRRRWAEARVEEVLLSGRGREAATDVALAASCSRPGPAGSSTARPTSARCSTRVSSTSPSATWRRLRGERQALEPSTLWAPLSSVPYPGDVAGEWGRQGARERRGRRAARVLDRALPSVRACRDSRAALRPELGGTLVASLSIDGDGRASDVKVRGRPPDVRRRGAQPLRRGGHRRACPIPSRRAHGEDPHRARDRFAHRRGPTCVAPSARRSRRCRCRCVAGCGARDSPRRARGRLPPGQRSLRAPGLGRPPRAARAGAHRRDRRHRARRHGPGARSRRRRRGCRLHAARGRASRATPDELGHGASVALVGDEKYPACPFKKRYKAANDDAGRLAVVRQFLAIAPHDGLLRKRMVRVARGDRARRT